MAGPTTDYGYTNFGSDTTATPGYVTESVADADLQFERRLHVYLHASLFRPVPPERTPSAAKPYDWDSASRYNRWHRPSSSGRLNPVVNFSVDGSAVAPRRTVVAEANCNNCHVALSLHGGLRNNVEYCVLCHNPSNTDASTRATAVVASDKPCLPRHQFQSVWCIGFTTA